MEARRPEDALPARSARLGAAIAGAGGVLLFLALFLNWYEFPGAGIGGEIGDAIGLDLRDRLNRTGWESFEFTDLLCALAAGVAVLRAAVALLGDDENPAIPGPLLAAGLGAAAVVLVAYRIANPPGVGFERELGVWLGLLGALTIIYGSATAVRSSR
ncbi:MAG: hypothetical protein M3O25_09640 [Actinomycetota bacterium]|nr:hypothetical protein [Actinomycetota bacterium]